jgi:hypothetical protein
MTDQSYDAKASRVPGGSAAPEPGPAAGEVDPAAGDLEIPLDGGNVGGAVRVGDTVRRPTGAWTPAVHGLLKHLEDAGLWGVPRVLGFDARGREVLTFLPGSAYGEDVPDEILAQALRWLREYHHAVASYRPQGVIQWRTTRAELGPNEIICMHDFGYYNWIGDANGFVGVIDWDMAGPGIPLQDLAFAAWNTVPLATPVITPQRAAERLNLMAAAYGGVYTAAEILEAAPARALRSARVIRAGQQAGDPGMLNLQNVDEPARTERRVADLVVRLPQIAAHL